MVGRLAKIFAVPPQNEGLQFGANQTDVFLVDDNGQLTVSWVAGEGAWNGPLKIGPAGIAKPGSPVAASQQFGANQTDVFLVDNNGQLNVFWVVGEGAWNTPLKIGPAGIANPGSPVAASQQFGANQTDVFLVDKNGLLGRRRGRLEWASQDQSAAQRAMPF